MIAEVTDADFEVGVLKADLPVLVDFWAPWCGPCQRVAPIVHEVADETEGKLKVCTCNVDEANVTAANYGIMGIPSLLVFKNGEVVEQMTGVLSKDQLMSKIAEHVGSVAAG